MDCTNKIKTTKDGQIYDDSASPSDKTPINERQLPRITAVETLTPGTVLPCKVYLGTRADQQREGIGKAPRTRPSTRSKTQGSQVAYTGRSKKAPRAKKAMPAKEEGAPPSPRPPSGAEATGPSEEEHTDASAMCVSDEPGSESASMVVVPSTDEEAVRPPTLRDQLAAVYPGRQREAKPTSLEYIGLARAKQAWVAAQRDELDLRLEAEVVGAMHSATSIFREGSREEGITGVPTLDLLSSVEDALKAVEKVAGVSKGLKGTLVKSLRGAVALTRAAANELGSRAYGADKEAGGEGSPGEQFAELRRRLAAAESENADLRAKLEGPERAGTASPKPSPPAPSERRERGTLRRRVRRPISASSEEEEPRPGTRARRGVPSPPPSLPSPPVVPPPLPLLPPRQGAEGPQAGLEALFGRLMGLMEAKFEGLREEVLGATRLRRTEGEPPRHRREPAVGSSLSLTPSVAQKAAGKNRDGRKEGGDIALPRSKSGGGVRGGEGGGLVPPAPPLREKAEPATSGRPHGDAPLLGGGQVETRAAWTEVVRRGARKTGTKRVELAKPAQQQQARSAKTKKPNPPNKRRDNPQNRGRGGQKGGKPSPQKRERRTPRSEAVTITCPDGEYKNSLQRIKEKIALEDLGAAEGFSMRSTRAGAIALEISGENRVSRADEIASKLKKAVEDDPSIRVARPRMMAEIRVSGLDISVSGPEVSAAIAAAGECGASEVAVGPIRPTGGGTGSAWAKCPIGTARALAARKYFLVGWSRARVALLEGRPLQCFKCLEGGHIRATCRSEADRSGRCYRCGKQGHAARDCTGPLNCPLCADLGRPADHRAGGKACRPSRTGTGGEGSKKGRGSRPPPTAPTPSGTSAGLKGLPVSAPAAPPTREAMGGETAGTGVAEALAPLPQRKPRAEPAGEGTTTGGSSSAPPGPETPGGVQSPAQGTEAMEVDIQKMSRPREEVDGDDGEVPAPVTKRKKGGTPPPPAATRSGELGRDSGREEPATEEAKGSLVNNDD